MKSFVKKSRGASMVEYALLLAAILILAATAYRNLGPKVGAAASTAATKL